MSVWAKSECAIIPMDSQQPTMSLAIQMPLTVLAVDQDTSAARTYIVSLKEMKRLSALVQTEPGNQTIAHCP